jgi:hypothetical protein
VKRLLLWILLFTLLATALLVVAPVGAAPAVPDGCVDHVPTGGEPDVPGDVRCAGMFIDFHLGGAARSPRPIWAGQWAVLGSDGVVHRGWCVHNRGVHPTMTSAADARAVDFPNDPGGRRSAYLASRYGDTSDALNAAALWAVFHWYALDAAGSARSDRPTDPLLPRLDVLVAATGNLALQQRAIALDAEAASTTDLAPPAVLWWGSAAWADPQGVQPLLAAGAPAPPTTTTDPPNSTTTSEPATTTTQPATTTTEPATTSSTTEASTTSTSTSTTQPPATSAVAEALPLEPDATEPAPPTSAAPLPDTGGGVGAAPLALCASVAGAGLIGATRRRTLRR